MVEWQFQLPVWWENCITWWRHSPFGHQKLLTYLPSLQSWGQEADYLFIYLFVYLFCCTRSFFFFFFFFFFGCVGSSSLRVGFSLVAASGGYSSLRCMDFSLRWLLLLWSTGSRCVGFSSCGAWAQQLWCTGLVALWHVGSSQTRA